MTVYFKNRRYDQCMFPNCDEFSLLDVRNPINETDLSLKEVDTYESTQIGSGSKWFERMLNKKNILVNQKGKGNKPKNKKKELVEIKLNKEELPKFLESNENKEEEIRENIGLLPSELMIYNIMNK